MTYEAKEVVPFLRKNFLQINHALTRIAEDHGSQEVPRREDLQERRHLIFVSIDLDVELMTGSHGTASST